MIFNDPVKNTLGLKALAWDYRKGIFVSPARPEFVWSPGGLQASTCGRGYDHKVPELTCTCGLYASYNINIINEYTDTSPISPIFLVEASGRSIRHEYGFRSAEMTIRMVALPTASEGVLKLAAYQAADYFKVELRPLADLTLLMDLHNMYLYQSHEVPYRPFSDSLRKIPYESLLEQVNQRMNG